MLPVLDAMHRNEARRFVVRVDDLYDRRGNLILAAAAPHGQGRASDSRIRKRHQLARRDTEQGISHPRASALTDARTRT
jgi:predicted ATPase